MTSFSVFFLVSSALYCTIKITFYCFKRHIETSGLITESIKAKGRRCVCRGKVCMGQVMRKGIILVKWQFFSSKRMVIFSFIVHQNSY